jgi:hypothetical protein
MGALYWALAVATCTMVTDLQAICTTEVSAVQYANQGQCNVAYKQVQQDNTMHVCVPICTNDGYICGNWFPPDANKND